jgi:hypothetical protein
MDEAVVLVISVFAVVLIGLLFFSRLRVRTIALALVAGALLFVGSLVLIERLMDRTFEKAKGPRHIFELASRPDFLLEDVALDKASTALTRDGYVGETWHQVENRQTSAPDGRRDVYLARSFGNPNVGTLLFTNAQRKCLAVRVELKGQQLICQRIAVK